jgi:hypothetical protein
MHFSKRSGLETPNNVNIEYGESKKQLLQIGELYFDNFKVFLYFGKEYYQWSDGRGIECLVTDWLIKEQFSKHIAMQTSTILFEDRED